MPPTSEVIVRDSLLSGTLASYGPCDSAHVNQGVAISIQ